jgi:lysophospholipase L1-like esterase
MLVTETVMILMDTQNMTDSVYPNLIVCGDSTAVGMGAGSPCLAASLKVHAPDRRIGQHGFTAEEIYQHILTRNLPEGPCIVVVTFGTNDVARGVDLETTIEHIRKILEHFRSRGHLVIGLPPYPFHRLPLVEAVLNNWQGEYENTQDMQTFFNDLSEMYTAFSKKSLEEIQGHADALIARMKTVFRDAEQPFLLELIEGVRDKPFEERKRSFQCDGIHPTEKVYSDIAHLIQSKINELSQFMLGQSANAPSPSL